MKRVTIQDIARVAQVSKSTVSRVLNGTAAVHPEKKKAVLDATRRLGFQPDVVARSLARGRSMTIGVLTQLIGSPFYDTISQGVIAGLQGSGYWPLFVDGQWRREAETEGIRALLGRRVDGLILIGGTLPAEQLASLCGDLPTVVVARRVADERRHCIYVDNVAAGRLATQHLLEAGHRRIAHIRGLPDQTDAADRYTGYLQALADAGISPDPELVLEGDFSAESGLRAVETLLAEKRAFSAIFAANDITAFGARLGLYRRQLGVPEQVSLVGFDDQMESAFTTPPLTTIRQPAREMGRQAAAAVRARIDGAPPASEAVEADLIVRESVGPPPA